MDPTAAVIDLTEHRHRRCANRCRTCGRHAALDGLDPIWNDGHQCMDCRFGPLATA